MEKTGDNVKKSTLKSIHVQVFCVSLFLSQQVSMHLAKQRFVLAPLRALLGTVTANDVGYSFHTIAVP